MSYAVDRDSSIVAAAPSPGAPEVRRLKCRNGRSECRSLCAELLQAARSHPGCGPPLTNPPRIICVIPPKSVSRFFAPPLPIASLFRMELCLLLLSA